MTVRSAFITGASSGIGQALAIEYARRGTVLGLVARRAEKLEQLAATLPVRTLTYIADVRDAKALSEAALDFIVRAGCPDIVLANAGVSAGTLTASADDNQVFEEILATNVTGMMLTFQPFLEAMRTRRSGTLAGIASMAGFRGLPGARLTPLRKRRRSLTWKACAWSCAEAASRWSPSAPVTWRHR